MKRIAIGMAGLWYIVGSGLAAAAWGYPVALVSLLGIVLVVSAVAGRERLTRLARLGLWLAVAFVAYLGLMWCLGELAHVTVSGGPALWAYELGLGLPAVVVLWITVRRPENGDPRG